jgi:hypothetical protein
MGLQEHRQAKRGAETVKVKHQHSPAQHAVLITAYKNPQQIVDIVNYLNSGFKFYVHVDTRSKMDTSRLGDIENVHVFQRHAVKWGSINHLHSILLLSKEALSDPMNQYFHLITGQDFPVKSADHILHELDTSNDYLEHFRLPSEYWQDNGGMDRLEYYNPYEVFDYRTLTGKIIIKLLVMAQKILKIKRRDPRNIFPLLFGGSSYWSLSRRSVQYVIDFTNTNPAAIERLKYTFCSEEIYFQTVLLNSSLSSNIVNDNLRYIDWSPHRSGNPAFLDDSDYEKVRASNKIFARKFHETTSERLRKLLIEVR